MFSVNTYLGKQARTGTSIMQNQNTAEFIAWIITQCGFCKPLYPALRNGHTL